MSDPDPITDAIRRITAKGFDPRSSTWPQKVCVMLHAAQGIIDNGGFEYFFETSFDGSPDMQDFPRVFDAVGATESADAIRDALTRSQSVAPDYSALNAVLWRKSEENYEKLASYMRENPFL